MDNFNIDNWLTNIVKSPTLKRIFDKYAEDTITNEQLLRVLDPILVMIREGRFDTHKTRKIFSLLAPVLSIAAALAITFTLVFSHMHRNNINTVIIPYSEIPLAAMPISSNIIEGRFFAKDKGIENITLVLQDTNGQLVDSTITNDKGEYLFKGFKDGVYMLKVVLPSGMTITRETDGFIEIRGKTKISFDSNNTYENIDVEVTVKD